MVPKTWRCSRWFHQENQWVDQNNTGRTVKKPAGRSHLGMTQNLVTILRCEHQKQMVTAANGCSHSKTFRIQKLSSITTISQSASRSQKTFYSCHFIFIFHPLIKLVKKNLEKHQPQPLDHLLGFFGAVDVHGTIFTHVHNGLPVVV